jgi:hypothetical protein
MHLDALYTGKTAAEQYAHRRAALGMLLRHSGHSRTFSPTGSPVLPRAMSALMGFITKKNTAAAMRMKAMSAFRNPPYGNVVPGSPPTVKESFERLASRLAGR